MSLPEKIEAEPTPVVHAPVPASHAPYTRARNSYRGNSIEAVREIDTPFYTNEKSDSDSTKKNDIEADIKTCEARSDSDIRSDDDEYREPNKLQKFCATHAKAIRIGIHIFIAALMTA